MKNLNFKIEPTTEQEIKKSKVIGGRTYYKITITSTRGEHITEIVSSNYPLFKIVEDAKKAFGEL